MSKGENLIRILVLGLVLVTALGFLAGARTAENEFVMQVPNYLQKFDPQDNFQMAGFMLRGSYETLVTYKVQAGPLELEPCLAQSWEVVDDGGAYLFHLRSGVTFHDGAQLDAEAVKVSFDRAVELELAKLGIIEGVVDSVEVVDELTVKVVLSNPLPSLLYRLTDFQIVSPLPVKNSDDWGQSWYLDNMAGTGPYMLDYRDPPSETALKRFDNYWGGWEGEHFDKVRFVTVTESATAIQMLEAGDIDMLWSAPVEMFSRIKANPNLELVESSAPTYVTIAMNTTKWPTSDIRIRRAISYALDFETCIELIGGRPLADNIRGPLSEANPYYEDSLPWPEYNLERAKQLLADAGHPNGEGLPTLELIWSRSWDYQAKTVQVLKEGLAQIGITLEIYPLNFASMLAKNKDAETGAHMSFIVSYPTEDAIPDQLMSNMMRSGGRYNWSWFSSTPQGGIVDYLIDEARFSLEEKDREVLYKQLQQIAVNNYLALWPFKISELDAIRSDVQGYVMVPGYTKLVPVYHMWKER